MKALVAGIGNIFLGDDGFGVEVVEHLDAASLPGTVHVRDYGIRGMHLALDLLDGYDVLVLIDAIDVGEAPGTLVSFEPSIESGHAAAADAHSMSPEAVLGFLARFGATVPHVVVVGCQPFDVDERLGLSAVVASVVAPAAGLVRRLLGELSDNLHQSAPSATPA